MSTFWERRKAAVAAETEADVRAAEAALVAEREAELAEKSDEELLEEFGLPDPDTLGEGDDFKQFLTDAVPARLKTRALRRLWRVNPVLANLDGLIDYGEDFTDSAMVVENLQTAYQVGKGMMAHVEELARQAEHAEAETDAEAVQDGPDETEEPVLEEKMGEEQPVALAAVTSGDADPEVDAESSSSDEGSARPLCRMAFTFETEGVG